MIRGLQNTVGDDQDPPHFLKLFTTEKPHTVVSFGVMQNLLKSMERGSKLLTGSEKQRLDKMFTIVIVQGYMQVQQVPNDTDPLMWWKQHQQELPDLTRMARQYLTVPATVWDLYRLTCAGAFWTPP